MHLIPSTFSLLQRKPFTCLLEHLRPVPHIMAAAEPAGGPAAAVAALTCSDMKVGAVCELDLLGGPEGELSAYVPAVVVALRPQADARAPRQRGCSMDDVVRRLEGSAQQGGARTMELLVAFPGVARGRHLQCGSTIRPTRPRPASRHCSLPFLLPLQAAASSHAPWW